MSLFCLDALRLISGLCRERGGNARFVDIAFGVVLCSCLNAPNLLAEVQVQFEPATMVMSPTINDVSGTYVCKVTNIAKSNLTITDVKGGCSCIVHNLSALSLAPGASADLSLVFDFKDYVGPQKRKITLVTKAEGEGQTVQNTVMLTGEIPTPLEFSKKAAIWLYGDTVATKEITIKIKDGFTVEDLRVETPAASHFVTIDQTFDAAAKKLSLKICPTTTDVSVVSPTEKANLQLPYVVKYKLPSGVQRYERFWVLLIKRPEKKEPAPPADPPKPNP